MVRRQTRTGQQYSEATPFKLAGFRYLMRFHAGVCKRIQNKYSQERQQYLYIDLNCGAGYQPEYAEFGEEVFGSPIIALQELNQQGIEPICHFCDVNPEALASLRQVISEQNLNCEAYYWEGENRKSLGEISKALQSSNFQGIVYSDPNGKQDFPLKEIKEFLRLPKVRKVELLLNISTTYVKRWGANPKTSWEVYSLDELVNGHGKDRVFLRKPDNSAQKWTFVYATNWKDQKELLKIRLYDIKSETGKNILEHIFNPKFNPLPYIDEKGHAANQLDLFS